MLFAIMPTVIIFLQHKLNNMIYSVQDMLSVHSKE